VPVIALHLPPASFGTFHVALEHQELALVAEPACKPRPSPQERFVRDLGRDLAAARALVRLPLVRDDEPPVVLGKLLGQRPLLGGAFGPPRRPSHGFPLGWHERQPERE
jgi:hypothetical protein